MKLFSIYHMVVFIENEIALSLKANETKTDKRIADHIWFFDKPLFVAFILKSSISNLIITWHLYYLYTLYILDAS